MITYGYWDGDKPHRPMVHATFSHPNTGRKVPLCFIVDTGADRTFIVPEHQRLLAIPEDYIGFETEPVHTISGKHSFRFLTHCTLDFTAPDGKETLVSQITVYFASPNPKRWWQSQKSSNESLIGEGDFPSILGRDVLHELCMGYCNTSDYLFLSKEHGGYYNSLSKLFPSPKQGPKWLGTPFDIATLEHKAH